MSEELTRRAALASAAVATTASLAACGSSDDSKSGKSDGKKKAKKKASGTQKLGKASDIKVGGGKAFKNQHVVVTQPTKGKFKAFSNICTHQGCPMTEVSGGTINCKCHGSKFKIADGSVAHGPAKKPLPKKSVTVKSGNIVLGA